MATPRLLLGTGATQYVISSNKASSTYGGAARADVSLWVDPGWNRRDAGSRTHITFMVEIDAADAATFKSRYEELRGAVVDTTRDFVFESDTSSAWLEMKTSTREYVGVSGEMETLPGFMGTTKAQIVVSFIGERAILSAGSGSAGGIENPTGVEDAPKYEALFNENGTLVDLRAKATFVGSSSVDAHERAASWRSTWASSAPTWLSGASALKDLGPLFEFDATKNECAVTLRFTKEPAGAPAVDATVTVWRYSATLAPHEIGHRAGEDQGPPGGDGKILTVTGELALRGDDESEFGGLDTAPAGGLEALNEQILILIEHAKQKASAGSARTLAPLSVEVKNSGWSASFSWSAIVDTKLLSWRETVKRDNPNPATVMRNSSGADRVYAPAGGAQRRITHTWSGRALHGEPMPELWQPSEDYITTQDKPDDPDWTSLRGAGDDAYARVRTVVWGGTREYLILSQPNA